MMVDYCVSRWRYYILIFCETAIGVDVFVIVVIIVDVDVVNGDVDHVPRSRATAMNKKPRLLLGGYGSWTSG